MQSVTLDDADLIERCRSGARDAFGELVGRYQDAVCAITYSVTGDLGLSEDLAQETFVSAWSNLASLREPRRLRPWLCSIARNKARDALRGRGRDAHTRAVPVEAVVPEGLAAPPGEAPDEKAIGREEVELLWRALERLPETYREPLVLYYRQNKSVKEVSECLELSPDTVRQRLARGRAELRSEVAAIVEDGLRRSRPGKAFSSAVVLALAATSPQLAAATITAKGAAAAKSTGLLAAIGAWLGPLIGVLGGVLGTWCSYRSARGPRERRFVLVVAALCLLYILVFFETLAASREWFRDLGERAFAISQAALWGAYLVGLLAFIVAANRRQKRIQIEEGTYREPAVAHGEHRLSRPAVYGSLGGGIFGSISWLLALALQSGDALSAVLVPAGGLALFIVSSHVLLARGRVVARKVSLGVWAGILALNALMVNLRLLEWLAALSGRTIEEVDRSVPVWGINLLLAVIGLGVGGLIWSQMAPPRQEEENAER